MESSQRDPNLECAQRLDSLDLSEYVVVLGSGPSSPFVASVLELEKRLCDRCGLEKLPGEEFWNLAERAFQVDETAYYTVIEETYSRVTFGTSNIYRHILSLPFRGFVTFNYDRQIPDLYNLINRDAPFTIFPPATILDKETGESRELVYASASDFTGNSRPLFAVHGCYSDDNPNWARQTILKRSDYNEHYATPSPYPLFDFWRNMLVSVPCLFVGTSLREPGLDRVAAHLLTVERERIDSMKHLHFLDADLTTFTPPTVPQKSLGIIEQLFFDPIDREFLGLTKIFQDLDHKFNGRTRNGVFGPDTIKLLDTFKF